ncbi:MAG: tyrosine-protein phosphatase [Bacteroidetes bacterium]|nr:tyrosine-protein phosphatase [Bacteroidota bacterium]
MNDKSYNIIKISFYIILLFFSSPAFASDGIKFNNVEDKIEYYKNRYGAKCLNDKITDNFGNGYEALYGTRNMRTILYGIAYRGGANNFYHKSCKRDNHNPLPEDGLINLAQEGFSTAVYLYSINYDSSKHEVVNIQTKDTLKYLNLTGSKRKTLRKVLELVADVINNPDKGPIYFHCWNGWHQSGLISAVILMQFCGYSNEKALDYWLENTDGVNKGYENVKSQIKNFNPFDDLKIDNKTQSMICPCEQNMNK